MNNIKLAENLVKYRRKLGLTQTEVANYIGVTKASVSKWENAQSYPDILLLPQLATYFGITIDELMGYEAQLSKESIEKYYTIFAEKFASNDFEIVMNETLEFMHEYYSCYELLVKLSLLWINHYMIAKSVVRQKEILQIIAQTCDRVIENCENSDVKNEAVSLKCLAHLMEGKPDKVLDILGEDIKPLCRNDELIIQAFSMLGNIEKSKEISEILLYEHLILLLQNGVNFITYNIDNPSLCEKMISRVEKVIETFDVDNLNGNLASIFYYQCALFYCSTKDVNNCINYIKKFEECVEMLLKNLKLHGDDVFTHIENWFSENDMDTQSPRNIELVQVTVLNNLENPQFEFVSENNEYKKILEKYKKICNNK